MIVTSNILVYSIIIIIEYNHADPNNYSQPMHNNNIIIIVVHNYIVVTLYILVPYSGKFSREKTFVDR